MSGEKPYWKYDEARGVYTHDPLDSPIVRALAIAWLVIAVSSLVVVLVLP